MKKIKIMLTAIAVFAVVGGALASKAKNHTLFCETTQAAHCVTVFGATFVVNPNPIGQLFCTTVQNNPCGAKQMIYADI